MSYGFSSTAEKNGNCFETEFNILKLIQCGCFFYIHLCQLKGSGQKRPNSHFGFFKLILCSKVVDFLHVTQHYCIMLIFGNKKRTSQKYHRTLIFLIMLGYMQKVSHF